MELPEDIDSDLIEGIINSCKDELQIPIYFPTLGCGEYGCVFPSAPGTVVKITRHKKEADAADFIIEKKLNHPALPKILGVWTWRDCHQYDEPIYIIQRENLSDLDIDLEWFEKTIGILEIDLFRYFANRTLTSDQIYEKLAELFEESPGNVDDELKAEQIAELYAYLIKHGAWLDDVLIENFGKRGEQAVLRDLGAFYIR